MKSIGNLLRIFVFTAIIAFSATGCKSPVNNSDPLLTGTVIISGTARVGQTLTVNTSFLKGSGAIVYQWKREATNVGTDSSTYIVAAADVGSTITVTVTRAGFSGSIASEPTAIVSLPTLTGAVIITGTAQVGQTMTANTSGLGGSWTIIYQWKRGSTSIGTNNTYIVQSADVGSTITVTVSRSGYSGSVTSAPTDSVTNASLPTLTGTVSITGTAQVGQTLTANTLNLGGRGTITYQWKRGSTSIGTNNTYVIQSADVGSTITVTVSRSGNSGSVTSAPTASVTDSTLPALTGTVSIIGTAQVGQTLTANTASLGGSGIITYQWKRGSTIIGTNNTYIIQSADVGSIITVTVSRSGNSGSVFSAPTAVVTDPGLVVLDATVTITGTAQVGQTLIANTTGLGGSWAIAYQWRRGSTDVGTNSSTYTVAAADVGSTITVFVYVTHADYSGIVISNPTAVVTNTTLPTLTGTVSITGTAQVGLTLTANTASLGGSGTITYQWKRGSTVVGTSSSTYTVAAGDVGYTITVTVTRVNNSGSVTSASTATIIEAALPALTGTVSITGTAQVGQTLTANTASLGGSGTITYQWKRGSTVVGTDSNTYTVLAADVGSTITVTVTRANNSGSVTSASTATIIEAALPTLTGTVSITGTAQVGQTLTASTASLGGSGTITYQWKRGSTVVGTNSNTYTVQSDDVGYTITVTVTRTGNSGSVTGDSTTSVSLPTLTGAVSITGTAQVGQTLTANTLNFGGSGTITYQWKRGSTNIGTNSSTYTVLAADVGSTITVTVTLTGNSGSVTSTSTATVIAAVVNQNPVASDFNIGNLTQTVGNVTPVTVTPKANKSTGTITVYYNWSTKLPTAIGTYTVTFDVAAATGWNAATGLAGETLTINAAHQNPIPTEITIAMWDSYGDGWDGAGALRININGNDIYPSAKADGSVSNYSFTALTGDMVSFYWIAGSNQSENAFAAYYSNDPPNPAFSPNPGSWAQAQDDPGGKVLIYRQYNTMNSISGGALLGSFTVSSSSLQPVPEGINITFSQLDDLAPAIAGPALRIVGSISDTAKTISIANPAQYESGSIKWFFNGNQITGSDVSGSSGEILTLRSSVYNKIGTYFVTVEVTKAAKRYSKAISFTVGL